MAVLIVTSIVVIQYPQLDRSESSLADEYARVVLDSLPPNAVLFVGGDNQIGPIGYHNKVRKHRADVDVYSKDGLLFRDKVVPLHSSERERLNAISTFQQRSGRRVFTTDRLTPSDTDYGLYYEFQPVARTPSQIRSPIASQIPSQTPSPTGSQIDSQLGALATERAAPEVLLPEIELFADYLIYLDANDLIHDGHEKVFLHSLLVSVSRQYSQYAVRVGTPALGKTKARRLASLQKTLPGKLSGLRTLLMNKPSSSGLLDYALGLERQLDGSIAKQHDALVYEFIARIYDKRGDTASAIEYFRKSIAAYPTHSNASLCELKHIANAKDFANVLSRYRIKLESCGGV